MAESEYRDAYVDRAAARVELDQARQEGQVEVARGALRMIVEAAEYVSDRTTHLTSNVTEGMKAAESLGTVSRQIRTLSGNTSLEASRLGGNPTVSEIARQMRLLSQQVTALTEHLSSSLRSQSVTLGELNGAIDAVLADAVSTQAILERGLARIPRDRAVEVIGPEPREPDHIATLEEATDVEF